MKRDGKTWCRCLKHDKDGNMTMYVTHHPDDYDQWLKNKRNWKKNKSPDKSSTPTDKKPKRLFPLLITCVLSWLQSVRCQKLMLKVHEQRLNIN